METLIDHLIYVVEQRIGAVYVEEAFTEQSVEQDMSPYSWYVFKGGNEYCKYSVEALQEVPISYKSGKGFVVLFTSEDTVHTAFMKIIKSEYETAFIDGIICTQDQLDGFTYKIDLATW